MRFPIRLCLWALPVALGAALPAPAAPPADGAWEAGPVVVTLRPAANVTASPVCVGHVASLSGGTPALREQIARLDLADRPRLGKPLPLLRELIVYRIQVAGIERGRYRVQGAPVVQVTPGDGTITDDDVLDAAREALLDKLPWRPEDVVLSLVQAPPLEQPALTAKDDVRLDAEPREPINAPGRVRVDLTLVVNGERLAAGPALVDVTVRQPVAVALRRIDSGESLGEDNVRFERRAISAAEGYVTAKDVGAGRKAKRPIAAGQVVTQTAVEALTADNPVFVRQRDLVKVLARVGNLRVTALAEAEQEGHAGDRIRVRNVDSRKEVVGRVVGRGLVEVEY